MNSNKGDLTLFKALVIRWGPLGALLVIVCSVYLTTLAYETSWDDALFFNKSPATADIANLSRVFSVDYWGLVDNPASPGKSPYYRPIALGAIILERSLFGANTVAFRLIHTALHLLNIVLVYLFVHRLANRRSALVAAALFAALPYTVDTVLFLVSICDLLVLAFSVLALICFHAWCGPGNRSSLAMAGLASIAALLSKESAVVLPAVMALVYWLAPAQNTSRTRALLGIGTSLVGVLAILGLRSIVIPPPSFDTLLASVPQFPAGLAYALRWAAFPYPLVLEHVLSPPLGGWIWWTGTAGIVGTTALVIRRGRGGGMISLGIVSWILFVIPSLLAVPLTGVFAPRYLYLPAIGLALVFGGLQKRISSKLPQIVIWVLILGTGTAALVRTTAWGDSVTLWAIELGRRPDALSALLNLGNLFASRGDYEQSVAFQLRAAEVAKKKGAACGAAFSMSNAAAVFAGHYNDSKRALGLYREAVALCPGRARNAWLGVARIHAANRAFDKADVAMTQITRFGPPGPDILMLKGMILAGQQRFGDALVMLRQARDQVGDHDPMRSQIDTKIKRIQSITTREAVERTDD